MKCIPLCFLLILASHLVFAQQAIVFTLSGKNVPVGKVGIRGSEPPLNWEETIYLTPTTNGYQIELSFAPSIPIIEYKYVVESDQGELVFELDGQENRLGILQEGKTTRQKDFWDQAPIYRVADLPPLPTEKLQEDARLLGQALWQLHPGVERHLDSTAFFRHLEELEKSFSTPRTYAQAFAEIARFVAKIQCGHTFANPFNQTGFIKNIILGQADKLPAGLTWIDGRLFVTRDATPDKSLVRGTEILSVNGVPTPEIAEQLLAMTKGDGKSNAKRYRDLEVVGYDYYESFDIYFPLVVSPKAGDYTLEIRNPAGKESTRSVQAVTREDRNQVLLQRFTDLPRNEQDTWQSRMIGTDIAYLKMGTFSVWNFEMNWPQFLKKSFASFKKEKAQFLILDVRGNEGGADEVLAVLQQYMMQEDCRVPEFQERTRFNYLPKSLRPYVFTWDTTVYDLRDRFRQIPGNYYAPVEQQEYVTFSKGRKPFDGSIYLLTDAANSSATFLLARIARECNLATIAGETTGGSLQGINGGNVLFFRLPNSGIEVDIPIFGQFAPDQPDRGVRPDLVLPRTIEGLLSEEDEQLETLIRKIRQTP